MWDERYVKCISDNKKRCRLQAFAYLSKVCPTIANMALSHLRDFLMEPDSMLIKLQLGDKEPQGSALRSSVAPGLATGINTNQGDTLSRAGTGNVLMKTFFLFEGSLVEVAKLVRLVVKTFLSLLSPGHFGPRVVH